MDDIELDTREPNRIDIHPLSKGRRVLCFLADYFLVFIIALLLFHVAAYPLGGIITKSTERYETYLSASRNRDLVLAGNKLLFYEKESEAYETSRFGENLGYTCKQLVSYYVLDNQQLQEYDVFRTYYFSLRFEAVDLSNVYRKYGTSFFTFDGGIALKDEYKEEFYPLFRAGDEISSVGQKHYEAFRDGFFLKTYSEMLEDIEKNDLVYEGHSYKALQKEVTDYNRYCDVLILACDLIAYVIAVSIVALFFPLASSRRKTLSMLFLRYSRVEIKDFQIFSQAKVPLLFIYMLAFCASCLMFIPWGAVGFNELFSLPMLFPLSLVGLALSLGALAFTLFDEFGRGLSDKLTFSLLVDETAYGEICRAKGYEF